MGERGDFIDEGAKNIEVLALLILIKHAALWAKALEYIVDAMNLEVARQSHYWCSDAAQAECALATLAVEMGVHVVEMLTILAAVAASMAHGILE